MSERVRAKFVVNKIELSSYTTSLPRNGVDAKDGYITKKHEMRTIVMNPVYSSDPNAENKKFWDASPSGELRLGTINRSAWEAFELDKEYYIDFTPAE